MEPQIGLQESCPWRSTDHCPVYHGTVGARPPVHVRVDVDGERAVACACLLTPAEAGTSTSGRALGSGQQPLPKVFQDVGPGFDHVGKAQWEALQPLLRRPMDGMSALGLSVFPEKVQDLLLAALQQGHPVIVRLNLDVETLEESNLAVLGIRALCHETGIELQVVGTRLHPPQAALAVPRGASGLSTPVPTENLGASAAGARGSPEGTFAP
jgi:hypothetical protein